MYGRAGHRHHEYIGESIYLWIQGKRAAVEGIDLHEDSEPEPPKGERQRRLIVEWRRLGAPVLAKLKGSLDPDRAVSGDGGGS